MTAYIDAYVMGEFRNRPRMTDRTDADASGALVTAKRFTDATKAQALPDKLAGFVYRLTDAKGYLGYAITARDKRLKCRDLGGFPSDAAAKQAIAEAYELRDGHPLQK